MQIAKELAAAAEELISIAKPKKGQIFVLGCSTSEVLGNKIGTGGSSETAVAMFKALKAVCDAHELYLAVQCCEHLNRAIITEREAAKGLDIVNVIPQPKAGGSFATAAYNAFKDPVALEEIRADAGLDIGGTLIGMHLKKVAVPLKLTVRKIGEANLTAARVRPKFIGGCRAVYDENML